MLPKEVRATKEFKEATETISTLQPLIDEAMEKVQTFVDPGWVVCVSAANTLIFNWVGENDE